MLNELKDYINKYLEPKKVIKNMYFKEGKEIADYYTGDRFVFIELEDGTVLKDNVTGDNPIDMVRNILFKLACI